MDLLRIEKDKNEEGYNIYILYNKCYMGNSNNNCVFVK